MTLLDKLRSTHHDAAVAAVAKAESRTEDFIRAGLLAGTISIPRNNRRTLKRIVGVGRGLSTKVNANIGTSPDHISVEEELEKLETAVAAGADAVMDLSTGGNLTQIRKKILEACPVPLGTVPIYQVACETVARGKNILQMDPQHMFDVVKEQAEQGVDFMTIHCGITRETVNVLERQKRLVGVVSRGGSFLVKWINATGQENPYYEQFDQLLEIAAEYDVTLSLGDGFRPGCTADANDGPQLAELSVLGELVLRCRKAGVQAIVEGPGHMPLDQIAGHVQLAKRLTHDAPLYLLGPLVTDIAAGYDHISGAIGGAIAASAGVDFLCYVTPAEHLRLPDNDDVYQGVIASRIAGHAADLVKDVPGARQRDAELSKFRKERNWPGQQKLALDPVKFGKERAKLPPQQEDVCTMCGQFCAMKDEG